MSEEGKSGGTGRLRSWIARRPGASVLLAAAVTLGIAAAIAIPILASKDSDISDLESQVADTSEELETAQAERDDAETVADAIKSRSDQIISSAKAQADKLVGDAEDKVDSLNDQIQQAESELTSTQSKLDSVNASLQQAQATEQMSTFSDGTWAVGEEILAGTYRSSAGGSCYWEILNAPSGGGLNNIVDNGFGPGATITVSTGQWVHVEDCGEWSPGP